MTTSVKIRAHHLFCLQGFQGYGYSPDFVKNMADVIAKLNAAPQTPVTLLVGQDAFCEACPHHGGATCDKDADADRRMRAMDAAALDVLGVSDGTTETFAALIDVSKRVTQKSEMCDVCGRCEWKEKCLWYRGLQP